MKKTYIYDPANVRRENENAELDRDGFPPCTMTVDEFCEHIRKTFAYPDFRIIAFRVRGYSTGATVTTRRGEMPGNKATKTQREACEKAINLGKLGK